MYVWTIINSSLSLSFHIYHSYSFYIRFHERFETLDIYFLIPYMADFIRPFSMAVARTDENLPLPCDADEVHHALGDLVWGRQATTCFYPAIVVNDPPFKFCTKIVLGDDEGTGRQYHVQFLGDNRLQWLQERFCMPFKGINHYESLVCKDVENMRIYKPKGDKAVNWRECIAIANELEGLEHSERLRRMMLARQGQLMGKTFIPRPESFDGSSQSDSQSAFPTKVNKPSSPCLSPKKGSDGRSQQYSRQDESEYKMLRDANKAKDKPKKKAKIGTATNVVTPIVPVFKTNANFDKSFKIKKDKKVVKPQEHSTVATGAVNFELQPVDEMPDGCAGLIDATCGKNTKKETDKNKEEGHTNSQLDSPKANSACMSSKAIEYAALPDTSMDIVAHGMSDYALSRLNLEADSKNIGLGEGALVWAKMRGYPYWPSVITRDPVDGQFVKLTETIYKNTRRLHVLFLEYENQRAWIGSSSLKKFHGLDLFKADKEKASAKGRPDYTPHKRIRIQFDRAVGYAEELHPLPDEERLEQVLLKYGWGMVEDDSDMPMEDNATDSGDKPVEVPFIEDTIPSSHEVLTRSSAPLKRKHSPKSPERHNAQKSLSGLPALSMQSKVAKTSAVPSPVVGLGDKDEFPRVGDLVWGRMPGFPFWPAFVTRNPDNIYRREMANGKSTYHVQEKRIIYELYFL